MSVILPVRNRAAWVARAVRSALEQTYTPIEVIAIDDGSTDDTREVLDSFGDRIVVLSQAHAGAYAARNRGLQAARGELIAFLDSDDRWFPDRLARQMPLMHRSEVGLVFGDALHVDGRRPLRTCVKLLEYLAAGLPVVATSLPEVRRFVTTHGPIVSMADDAQAFAAALRSALAEDTSVDAARRVEIARRHDWSARITAMSDLMEAALAARHDTSLDGPLAVVS